MSFTCYPAIDVRDGRVVRLQQGDYARETRYDDDPLARAGAFADAGARWLHLVDLDAARTGGYTLQPLLRRLAEDGRLRVQTGGGVRTREDVAALRAAGAARVVVGSLAVEQPMAVAEWLAEFGPESIVVALDVRLDDAGRWCPATRGWTQESGVDLVALLDIFRTHGLRHLLCTDIARDGMLSGPNLDLYASLHARIPGIALQASGGMRDANDVQAARAAGCAGAVLGRALLEGRLDLREALAC